MFCPTSALTKLTWSQQLRAHTDTNPGAPRKCEIHNSKIFMLLFSSWPLLAFSTAKENMFEPFLQKFSFVLDVFLARPHSEQFRCRQDILCILGVLAVLFLWNNRVRSCVSLKWRCLVWMPEAAFNAKIKWVCWYSVFQTGAITASTLAQQRSCSTELFPCVFYFQDKTQKYAPHLELLQYHNLL